MILDFFRDLNEQQKLAVFAPDGPTLVVAGAGSGKTKVLVHRVLHLIVNCKVKPSEVVCITFSTHAARTMRSRIEELVKQADIFAGTFHSFGLKILRAFSYELGYQNNFSVLDDEDSKSILKSVCKDLGSQYLKAFREISETIDLAKNMGKTFESESGFIRLPWEEYQKRLVKFNSMDFGDLLVNTKILLKNFPNIRERIVSKIRHILVDEVQDTNLVQYEILKLLTTPPFNLYLVGDEDQSIYSFRGARFENIQDFCKEFEVKNIYKLEQNYRSSSEILAVANAVISKNSIRHEKTLVSNISTGIKPVYRSFYSDTEEAEFVASVTQNAIKNGLEVAIFFRTNALSRSLEEAFIQRGLNYRIIGGVRFMERKEIKDCVSWLRFYTNRSDLTAFARVLSNLNLGLGKITIDKIISESAKSSWDEALKKHKNTAYSLISKIFDLSKDRPHSLLTAFIENTKYIDVLVTKQGKERLDNLLEFLGFAKQFEDRGESIKSFLDHISLISDPKLDDNELSKVPVMMTLHSSKGLEFDVVFIVGVEDGLIPHSFARTLYEVEEERRLFYVGITRAKKYLYLTASATRAYYYGYSRNESPFLWDIPFGLLDSSSDSLGSSLVQNDIINFEKEGREVNHYLYGKGRLIKVLDGRKALVEFESNHGIKFVTLSELS